MTEPRSLPPGFRGAGTACGIKKTGAPDLGLIVADEAWPAWAIYTQNHLLGAHIPVCHRHLAQSQGKVRAVLVNSGNANCATGKPGEQDNETVCAALAVRLDCPPHEVLFMSTGVIGAALPVDRIVNALPDLVDGVAADGIDSFASAIMTTDTHPKVVNRTIATGADQTVQITGIAKGSGMIHPDMATMLGFLLTDGSSPANLGMGLQALADDSFHRVTVDGDTSPNDTLLLWTTARVPCPPSPDQHGVDIYPLEDALTEVSRELSRMIAGDGEGATRLVTIEVKGAMSDLDTLEVGRFIATSPLVKTAIFGRDPNWGRILSSAGTSGIAMNIDKARVWIGSHDMYPGGTPHPENEAAASDYMAAEQKIVIGIDLGMGPFEGEVWTCDLSKDYVAINADYRT